MIDFFMDIVMNDFFNVVLMQCIVVLVLYESLYILVLIKLVVCGLDFYYDKFYVFKGIDLEILEKCVIVLIGLFGCGKFMLLCIFNCIYVLYFKLEVCGEVLLDGENIFLLKYLMNWLCSKVGMVFQKLVLFLMIIFENVVYGICYYEKLFKLEMIDCVEQVLCQGVLWDEVKDKFNQSVLGLFGGQQQCLCIVCVVVLCLDVLLLDELMLVLDLIFISCIEQLVEEFKYDYIIVIVIYNMQQVVCVFDYIVFMYLGDLIEYDCIEVIFLQFNKQQIEDYIIGWFG